MHDELQCEVESMMRIDETPEPRCTDCDVVLLRDGAICHACDVESHFEAPIRTSPPIDRPTRCEVETQASLLERSRVDMPFSGRRSA